MPLLPYDEDTIMDVAGYLHDNGYVVCHYADSTIYMIYLTYEGKNYREFKLIEIKQFLFRSVLVPIIVAFVTTLLMEFI